MKMLIYFKKIIQKTYITILILLLLFCLILWQHFSLSNKSTSINIYEEYPIPQENSLPIQPIPLHIKFEPQKVKLGDKLFHDPQLSHDNTISCANCHNLKAGGTDRLATSIGINGAVGTFNSPTIFNSGFNFKQFWDARAATIEDLIEEPINSPKEMGSSWEEILSKLKQSPEYVSLFNQIYSDGIQKENIKNAITIFVRSLYTPNAKFDKFLRGDELAITDEEEEGYRRFKSYGCISCHQGVNIGGNMLQTFGVMTDFLSEKDKDKSWKLNERDKNKLFKVPSLRNVALTYPYFHDGGVKTLEEAVDIMGRYQLGRKLSSSDINLIVKFLNTLTGEYQNKLL